MRPRLLALKTAVPPHVIAQSQAADYARSLFAQVRDIGRLIPVFENTGIAQRYSCVPIEWYLGDHGWLDRTELYVANAVTLLETVTSRLLEEAKLKSDEIVSGYEFADGQYVVIDSAELEKLRSQKDKAMFPGADEREFWQRAEERNRQTAKMYDQLGLAEYEAMEGFVRWRPDKDPRQCTFDQLAPELRPSELKELFG